jgi:hypothetical protein
MLAMKTCRSDARQSSASEIHAGSGVEFWLHQAGLARDFSYNIIVQPGYLARQE